MGAVLHKGSPSSVLDVTPTTAISAGDVVVEGELPLIAHVDIEANETGSLAAGGAIYTIEKEDSVAYNQGDTLYWNATDKKVTSTASTHKIIGYAAADAASDDKTCKLLHRPAG